MTAYLNYAATLGLVILVTLLPQDLAAQLNGVGPGAPPPFNFNGAPTSNNGTSSAPALGGNTLSSQPAARIAANGNANGLPSSVPDLSRSGSSDAGSSSITTGAASSASNEGDANSSIETGSLFSIIRDGGLLMFPILLCSFVLVVFIFERMVYLRRGRVIPKPFVRGVLEQLEQQQLDQEEAIALCEENGSPIAELFTAALKKWGRPAVEIEQAVVDAGTHITSQMKRYLRLFNAISNLTPLLGLLGTVQGMIGAFNSIAHAGAMGRPEMLASSIGTALITTAAGLCVAIPAYAAYVFFLGRADKLILEMDAQVSHVIEFTCAEAQASRRGRTRKAA